MFGYRVITRLLALALLVGCGNSQDLLSDALEANVPDESNPTHPIVPPDDQGEPANDPDPAWYKTPQPQGTGLRTVPVSASANAIRTALNSALPGDTIELAPGDHPVSGGNLLLSRSGTEQNWITIRGTAGSRPRINLQGSGEFLISASYVLLENVEIINGGGNNLHIAPTTSAHVRFVVVRGVKISNLSSGPGAAIKINRNNSLGAAVESIYIEECDVSQAIGNAVIDGVAVKTAVVRNCYIHDNAVGSHGIFFKGGSHQILLEGNLVRGIRQNAALMLGGNTGSSFFHPDYPGLEGADQVARNNFIADCDDSVFEVRGVRRGKIYNNTVVSQSAFAVFRLSSGWSASGTSSSNDDIEITNNLIVSTAGTPQFARNDSALGQFKFTHQFWIGAFKNSSSPGQGIPTFPLLTDKTTPLTQASGVLQNPTYSGLTSRASALQRYALTPASPARGIGLATTIVPRDVIGTSRAQTPSIGAFE